MDERIADQFDRLSNLLHWLGKYGECNACTIVARFCREKNLSTLEELESALKDRP